MQLDMVISQAFHIKEQFTLLENVHIRNLDLQIGHIFP